MPGVVRPDRIEHVIEHLAIATDAQLLDEVVALEAERIRVGYRQLAVLAELNSRNVPGALGYRGLSQLIATQLRYTQTEARKRTLAVERFGARRSVIGETLEPQFPATAEAFSKGNWARSMRW